MEKLEIKDAFVTYKQPRELGEVDYEKMKGNEDLLEMIGYRI